MNKRELLKFIGMAPVAAPMIASTVTDAVMKDRGSAFGYPQYLGPEGPTTANYGTGTKIPDNESIQTRLQALTQMLLKLDTEELYDNHAIEYDVRLSFYVDSLRSVSKSQKLNIMTAHKKKKNIENRKFSIEREIKELKKQLGLLGMIV